MVAEPGPARPSPAPGDAGRDGVELVDVVGQGLGQPRLAHAPGPDDPAGDDPGGLAPVGHALDQVGGDGPFEHVGHLVGDAGHGVDHLVAHRADQPGGGALGLGDDGGPLGHVGLAQVGVGHLPAPDWRTWSGCSPPPRSSRWRETFITSAMASRVMSSWVGPSPPQTMTPSLRARAVRKASTIRSWLSPTAWWKWEATPDGGQVLAHPLGVGVGDLARGAARCPRPRSRCARALRPPSSCRRQPRPPAATWRRHGPGRPAGRRRSTGPR